MATINYKLRSEKKGKLASIWVRFREGKGIDILVTTGFKILPEYWSNKTHSCKKRLIYTKDFTENTKNELEENLQELKGFILGEYNKQIKIGDPITKEWMKEVIKKYQNKDLKRTEDLNQYIERFINEIGSGKRTYSHNKKSGRYASLTIKNYKGFQVQFNEFQKEINRSLNFHHINLDIYDEFVNFFYRKNYSLNTIGRHIKNLKVIMRAAREERLHNNTEFENKRFRSIKGNVDNIYLSETEIKKLFDLDLSDNSHLEIARDIFLIGCYTAQRFSDFSRIKKENIRKLENGARVIELIQKKTNERVIIPIRPELDYLLKKYDYCVPKSYEQKINQRIKMVADKAGITEPISITQIKGGLTIEKTIPKNELIKTHTARRSGCTNMYYANIPVKEIMLISGHKSMKEFENYIKVNKEEAARRLSAHPMFKNSKMKIV